MLEQRKGMQEVYRLPTHYGDLIVYATKPSSRLAGKHMMIILEDRDKNWIPLTDVGVLESTNAMLGSSCALAVDVCNGQACERGKVAVEYRKRYEISCALVPSDGTMYRKENGHLVAVTNPETKESA